MDERGTTHVLEGNPERRSDGASRAICMRLDAIEREQAAMRHLVAGLISFRVVLMGMPFVLLSIGGFGLFFLQRAEAASKSAGSQAYEVARETQLAQRQLETFVKTELQDFKRELKADLADVKAEVRNNSRVMERTAKRAAVATDGGP